MVKMQTLSPAFPSMGSMLWLFIGYFFGISGNKASTISYVTVFRDARALNG